MAHGAVRGPPYATAVVLALGLTAEWQAVDGALAAEGVGDLRFEHTARVFNLMVHLATRGMKDHERDAWWRQLDSAAYAITAALDAAEAGTGAAERRAAGWAPSWWEGDEAAAADALATAQQLGGSLRRGDNVT